VGSAWGKAWLGQGDTASNGTSEVDLSGTDVAAYSSVGDVGWAKLAAAVAWSDYGTSSSTNDNILSSSASLLFDFGLNLTASYAYRKQDNTDPYNVFGKVGYQFLEKHAVSVQYARTKNLSAKDDKGDTIGLAYVFSPWKSVEFYGTYYIYMLDRDAGSNPDDINVGMIGGRVKF